MVEDIGYIIFVQLLQMAQYPGSPFTGNLFRDLIMFLIVPTIFIILVIYSMTGRIVADRKLRMMLGVGVYLFIIASGYYSAFALLSGPYFIFLIFIMGILYYFVEHFTGRRPQAAQATGEGGGGKFIESDNRLKRLIGIPNVNPADRKYLNDQLKKINERIQRLEKQIEEAVKHPGSGDTGRMTEQLDRLIKERQEIEDKLKYG